MQRPDTLPYLPALDGLRAVAVAAVVAYHLDAPWSPGGFLGVDLFFVISGYLITSLLLHERSRTGRIDVRHFLARRYRRLVPPLVVMIAATMTATRLWGYPQQWISIRNDGFAALAYVANWRFIFDDQTYFDTLLPPSPLRHTWSLAVEEQWYLLWPMLLVLIGAVTSKHFVKVAAVTSVVLGGASVLAMATFAERSDATRAYFGTDTRAQHLIVGALLAFGVAARPGVLRNAPTGAIRWVPAAAFGCFVGTVVLIDDTDFWMYQGGFLAVSVIGMIVVFGCCLDDPGPLRWLGAAPLIAIGKRSYGIYLWHWPVILFVGPKMGLEVGRAPQIVIQLIVIAALAECSFRLVERRARDPQQSSAAVVTRWSVASLTMCLVAVMVLRPASFDSVLAAGGLDNTHRLDQVSATSDEGARTGSVGTPLTTAAPTTTESTVAPDLTGHNLDDAVLSADSDDADTVIDVPETPPRVLLIGDSTALALADFASPGIPAGFDVVPHAGLGCWITPGNVVDVGSRQEYPPNESNGCVDWIESWPVAAETANASINVIMVGAWEILDHVVDGERHSFPSPEWELDIIDALSKAVDAVQRPFTHTYIMALPCMEHDPNAVFSALARADPQRVAAFNAIVDDLAAASPNIDVLPLDELLCPDGHPLGSIDGHPVRSDGTHVTAFGADYVWSWFAELVEAK